jgi:hypothetical protein
MVRAKFVVDKISKTRFGSHEIALTPVSTGSEENKEFFKWTPGGVITLSVVSDATVAQFEVGKEYYIDFTPAQ